jgi:hypothetical protein
MTARRLVMNGFTAEQLLSWRMRNAKTLKRRHANRS